MKIELIKDAHFTVMILEGKFDSPGSIDFDNSLAGLERDRYFILDFSEVKYLSSAGIRSLLNIEKTQRGFKKKVIYAAMNASVQQVLKLTGLAGQFELADNREEGIKRISDLCGSARQPVEYPYPDCRVIADRLPDQPFPFRILNTQPLTAGETASPDQLPVFSMEETGFCIGFGGLSDDRQRTSENPGLVMTYPRYAGFKAIHRDDEIDFRVMERPDEGFLFLNQAVSVQGAPQIQLDFEASTPLPVSRILNYSSEILEQHHRMVRSYAFWMTAECSSDQPGSPQSVSSFGLVIRPGFSESGLSGLIHFFKPIVPMDFSMDEPTPSSTVNLQTDRYLSMVTVHEMPYQPVVTDCIRDDLNQVIRFETIAGIRLDPDFRYTRGRLYLFVPQDWQGMEPSLRIENLAELHLTDAFELITRRIYSECSTIKLVELQGGFSARTFQVFGKDKQGLEILPTILKLSDAPIITREISNYQNHVKKFILNNTASIMGSFIYLDFGGLRYNFLGITGTGRLKWLRHLYNERPIQDVLPMVDRVYTCILKPWYGQPQYGVQNLYKDQDPVINFFGTAIFDMARQDLGIDADQPEIAFPELGIAPIINPYFFLKHRYPERYTQGFKTYQCICHGDLNLQNILLDDRENIYIIDFSETRPRNAVSDFARLEVILTTEYFKTDQDDDIKALIPFIRELLKVDSIRTLPEFHYPGNDPEVAKGYPLILRMREYARTVSLFETDLIPYLIAMLEWIFPIACYTLSIPRKKLSAVYAALIVEKMITLQDKN